MRMSAILRWVGVRFAHVLMVGIAALGLWSLDPVPASAQLELSTAVEPTMLEYPQQRVLTYRLAMATGDREERLSVAPGSLPFANRLPVTLEGPGVLGRGIHQDPAAASSDCPRHRTATGAFQYYVVTLPAHSTSVLVSPYRLVAAPWPHTDLRLTYSFDSFSPVPSTPITFLGSPGLRSPQPKLTGVTGVQIRLSTRPLSKIGVPARVRLGKSILIRGRTDPAVRGNRIVVRASHTVGSRRAVTVTVARVRVAADGRFRVRWRPRSRGTYGVYAVYHSQRAALSNDSTPCNLPFTVR